MPGEREFGLVIAFLLPGFLCLWGLSFAVPTIAAWLALSSQSQAPTVGGFLYVTLASLALGLLISAVRWASVDKIHELTGLKRPDFNTSALKDEHTLNAFQRIVESHYRFYQYYANTMVALIISFICYVAFSPDKPSVFLWIIFIVVTMTLFYGSRDALRKYYDRGTDILSNAND